jgi:hypothetical protein
MNRSTFTSKLSNTIVKGASFVLFTLALVANVYAQSNASPTITTPANVTGLCSGGTSSAISYTVTDAETAAGS